MNRRLLLLVTGPMVLVGIALFGVCLTAAWNVNQLQSNLSQILASNVSSMQAAQHLELNVRALRFNTFLYFLEPSPNVLENIHQAEARFAEWLERAEQLAFTSAEQETVMAIREGYANYESKLEQLRKQAKKEGMHKDLLGIAQNHPFREITDLCRQYSRLNQNQIEKTTAESDRVSRLLNWALLLLGVGGPLGGVLSGYGIARGLNRSIFRLSVRVQDLSQKLEEDISAIRLIPEVDLQSLDRQLDVILGRVSAVMEKFKRQQQEMLRAQQLAAVGQLAASVAHEIRNPLASIKMLVEVGMRPVRPKPMALDQLQIMHREIRRLEQTVQDFLDFARPPALQARWCGLYEIVRQSIELVQARARQQKVGISLPTQSTSLQVFIDPDQMRNVFVNLFLNALDVLPDGGRLEIDIQEIGRKQIEIKVLDDGPGLDPSIIDQLFTPFFSTKPTGSGLGLNICKRIVEEHSGTITAGNRAEGGAVFIVALPFLQG